MIYRITAIMLRYYYLQRRSFIRMMELFFSPLMTLIVWGFVTKYLETIAAPRAVAFFIGVAILWSVLNRSMQGITQSITEEFWAKNIINLFITPLSIVELLTGICLVGVIRSVISISLLTFFAWLFYSYGFLDIGPALVPFLANLFLFGWALGLATLGLIFRYGRAAQHLIWGVPMVVEPLSAVYYPVSVLPDWLQLFAALLPSSYVFEGMRQALATNQVNYGMLGIAFALNIAYMALASLYFGWMFNNVRKKGYLAREHME